MAKFLMRLLSYNILNGAEGRADPVAEVIEAQRADVIGLVEADHPEVLDRIVRRLDMDYVVAPGELHSVSLLTRWPILESINHALLRPGLKCMLEALVRDPEGREIPVVVLHLHPQATEADEQQREREIAIVLDILERHRKADRPHIVMGDFNANSPIQQIDISQVKESTRLAMQQNGGTLPRRVMQKLFDAGYLDTLAAADPQAARTRGSFSTQYPGQRVDYILTHGLRPGSIKTAWIETDRLAKYCSDHYPVGVELAI
jgi:endonuclease/exonuclease/phosphatase family metal-dependent hydrolase